MIKYKYELTCAGPMDHLSLTISTGLTNELPSKDGRALGKELGEDQECWHGGSDGHIFVSDVNKGAELRPTVRAPIPTQGLLTPNVSGSARPDGRRG